MTETFVNDLEAIFLTLGSYTQDVLPTIHKREVRTFNRYPALLILPERTRVESIEAGSEVWETDVLCALYVRDDETRVVSRVYGYELAMRRAVFANRRKDGRDYRATDSEYGLSRDAGDQMVKVLVLTIVARGQYNYV